MTALKTSIWRKFMDDSMSCQRKQYYNFYLQQLDIFVFEVISR